jgi:hypothetical protein
LFKNIPHLRVNKKTFEHSLGSLILIPVQQEHFFILGCQRTGTTLLRLILETHPELACYDEIRGYEVLQNSAVNNYPDARLVGFKLPRWTEQIRNAVLWDEGLPGTCKNFYRGEQILFLLRDVRDTIASMLKLKVGEFTWCELWVPRIIEAKLAREEAFGKRYAKELTSIEHCDSRLIGLAALYWKYKTQAFFDYREEALPVLAIPYEQLVRDPHPVLQSACWHLGIEFEENLLSHNKFQHSEVFANGLTLGNTDPRKPIQADSVGQWKQFLSAKDSSIIEHVAGDLSARVSEFTQNATVRTARE